MTVIALPTDRRFQDLTGQMFGQWTVLEYRGNRKANVQWLCRCDCGTEREVAGNGLKTGTTTSCGCSKREDLTGRVFGRLTVIGMGTTRRYRRNTLPAFICRCECGKEVEVLGQSLRQGKTVSCGCYRREATLQFADLTGQRFSRLIVLAYAGKHGKQQKHHWRCQCDCGKERIVRGSSLTSGHTASCGCYGTEQRQRATTTHGKSTTPAMIATYARVRARKKRKLDQFWTLEMERMLRDLQLACVVCGAVDDLATDHVNPLSKGYGLHPGNAVVLCRSCNSTKRAKSLDELPEKTAQRIHAAAVQFKEAWNRRK